MKQFTVGGMSCAACSARVERAVGALEGVESCSVNLLTGSMLVEGSATEDEIVSAVVAAGYTAVPKGADKKDTAREERIFKSEAPRIAKRLVISLAFLLVLMYFSMGSMLGFPLPENAVLNGVIQMLLSLAILIINRKFFTVGFGALIKLAPNMDTLVSLGSLASFAYSAYGLALMLLEPVSAHHRLHDLYFESAAMILVLITLGKLLESVAKGRTTGAIESLMKLSPKTALVIREGKEVRIPTDDVLVGDVFLVRPGESIPVDGEVTDGVSAVDESALTGESIPADKSRGSAVYAATVNKSGFLTCRATRVGEGTTIAEIIRMVTDASATKAPIAKIADKVSGIFVPAVLVIALVTGIIWLAVGAEIGFSLARAVSVLVISCPCALGLATPVAIMVGSGVGAKKGILFKNATALEMAGRVNSAALDKTGTLTEGHPRVTNLKAFGVGEEELLSLAYTAELRSEHPLAEAVRLYASEKGIAPNEPEEFEISAGSGVVATFLGARLVGGNLKFIEGLGIKIADGVREFYEKCAHLGETPLVFAYKQSVVGIIAVRDTVRPDSRSAIAEMKKMGIKVTMLTGDNESSARAIAREVGIDDVVCGILPAAKARAVQKLREKGAVMMVGDGINDAPALTEADVGVAIGRGTDVAIESADVVLTGSSLSDAVRALKLGRATLRNIKQNLFWAFCYNLIGIPLAAGAFISAFGWQMNPMFGAAAMSVSSFLVVMNSLRLNLVKLDFSSVKGACDERRAIDANDESKRRKFRVLGMMCEHCEGRVESAIKEIVGVKYASASHKTESVEVEADDSVSNEQIIAKIEGAGYKISQ